MLAIALLRLGFELLPEPKVLTFVLVCVGAPLDV